MSKYIKLEDAIEKCKTIAGAGYKWLADLPTIDIVTCKECKRWVGEREWYEDREYKQCQNGGMFTAPNHYCAWGERIEE